MALHPFQYEPRTKLIGAGRFGCRAAGVAGRRVGGTPAHRPRGSSGSAERFEATIANAAAARALHDRGETLDELLWRFAPDSDGALPPASGDDLVAVTPESTAMAKELKRRGFRFVGPTTAYLLMQAAGLVNDHLVRCEFRAS